MASNEAEWGIHPTRHNKKEPKLSLVWPTSPSNSWLVLLDSADQYQNQWARRNWFFKLYLCVSDPFHPVDPIHASCPCLSVLGLISPVLPVGACVERGAELRPQLTDPMSQKVALWVGFANVPFSSLQSAILSNRPATGEFATSLCGVATSNFPPSSRAFRQFPDARSPRLRVARKLFGIRGEVL
jgi:hypothetical protein